MNNYFDLRGSRRLSILCDFVHKVSIYDDDTPKFAHQLCTQSKWHSLDGDDEDVCIGKKTPGII